MWPAIRASCLKAFVLVAAAVSLGACSFRPAPPPSPDGPAEVIREGRSYYVLLPESQAPGFYCGQDSFGRPFPFAGRFTPTAALITNEEAEFRAAYRQFLMADAEELHPDSVGYITEVPGDVAITRPVSRRELLRDRRRRYERTLRWDRQYMGFLTTRGDSVLAVNMVDPAMDSRLQLADGWIVAFDAATNHVVDVAFNLSTGSVRVVCDALVP